MDIFEFLKTLPPIDWLQLPAWLNWTILIDLFGFTLAIIGFFNLADPIELYFRRLRDNASFAEKHMNETIKKVFPLRKNWLRLFKEGLRIVMFRALPAFLIAALVTGEIGMLWQWFRNTHWGWLALIAIVTPFGIFALAMISRIVANRLVKYVYWIIWRVVSIMAYPPSGILGTLGLGITIASFVINRM